MYPIVLILAPLLAPGLVVPGGEQPRFGAALALDGDLLAVGAPEAHWPRPASGALVLFRCGSGHPAGGWRRTRVLEGDGRALERFGAAVDLAPGRLGVTRLAVGAFFADGPEPRTGAVHLFEGDPEWERVARIVPSDAQEFDAFGWSIALEGERLLVGAPFASRAGFQSGDARVFRRVGGHWVEETALRPSTLSAFDHLGWAVSWCEGRALVGAPDADLGGEGAGAVFVFERTPRGWVERPALVAPALGPGAGLGSSLAADRARLVAGAPGLDRVAVWHRRAGGWEAEATLAGTPGSSFGAAVTLAGPWMLVGAPDAGAGEVHRFRRRRGRWDLDRRLEAPSGAGMGLALDLHALPGAVRAALGAPRAVADGSAEGSAGRAFVWE